MPMGERERERERDIFYIPNAITYLKNEYSSMRSCFLFFKRKTLRQWTKDLVNVPYHRQEAQSQEELYI